MTPTSAAGPSADAAAAPSILFLHPADRAAAEAASEPDCFSDLNLDQVMAAITASRQDADLRAFFHAPLDDVDAVRYRQEVFRDLRPEARAAFSAFCAAMRGVRGLLAERLDHRYQRESWFFEAAETYVRAVRALADALGRLEPESRALRRLRDYLADYVASDAFRSLADDGSAVRTALNAVRYNLRIGNGRVTVGQEAPGPDYTVEIEALFARFRRQPARDDRQAFSVDPDLSHARILDRIARLHPEAFGALDAFMARHRPFLDPILASLDREVQFYLAYLDFLDRFAERGLPTCEPRVSRDGHELQAREVYDVALASRLSAEGRPIVTNDVALTGPERILVVTGPNQGGKTTFARAFGQLLYLASLGCPVPAADAQLPLCDRVFTQFGREERLDEQRSRLEDELLRLRSILEVATSRSALVLNEVFSSTTLADAVSLSLDLLARIEALDLIGVWVTFVDELARVDDRTVSLVSNVRPDDPSIRTFKITRRAAEGRAYAASIAAKYGVSYERLRDRLSS